MRARILIAIAAGAALLASAAPAGAGVRPPDAYIDDDDRPTIEVTDDDDGTPGAGPADPACVWRVVIADDFVFHVYDDEGGVPQHSETGRWLQRECDGTVVPVGGRYLVPEGGLVDLEGLARQALASVTIDEPAIRTSPEADGRLYVHVPTWLWVEGTWWHTYEATASAGRVTATISARPATATWTMGDGNSVHCSGAGTPWVPGVPERATDCSHTYARSSAGTPGERFDLSATVTLEVTWVSNSGASGSLPAISRTATRAVAVGEIQAVGTAR